MALPRPFKPGPFDALPDAPRRPHIYFETSERRLEMTSQPFGKIGIRLREHGQGPPLLLVHGLMTSSYSFRYVMEPLGRHFRVIVPDLPGAGQSDKPDARYSGAALATWIVELVDALGIRGCAAIGNSLGGYLCMRAALDEPGLFGKLIDMHSPGLPEARLTALHAALSVPGVQAALARWVRRDPERWAHRNVHYFDESLKSREEAREYAAAISDAAGARAFVRYLADALAPRELGDFVAQLEALRAAGKPFPSELLMLYATEDPMVPPDVGRRLHALVPGAELVWLEQSSHFCHVDSPERVVEIALGFFGAG